LDENADWASTHTYRVRARGTTDSAWSLAVPALVAGDYSVYAGVEPPMVMGWDSTITASLAAPTGLAATAVHSSRIDLSWQSVAGASGYAVLMSWDDVRWTELGTTTSTTFSDDGALEPGLSRSYRVCAVDSSSTWGPWSAAVSAAPQAFAGDLAAPAGLTATDTGDGILLQWSDESSDETGFAIESASSTSPHYRRIATVAANTTTYTHSSGSRFRAYRVQALRDGAVSTYAAAVVPQPAPATGATGVSATAESAIAVRIDWTAAATGWPSGYAVERSDDGTTFTAVGWVAGKDTATWTDRDPPSGTTAHYRVRATSWVETFTTSAATTVSVPAVSGAPAAPVGLTATGVARNQINLHWDDLARSETGFTVERSTDGGAFTAVASLPADCRSWSDRDVATGTTYAYRLRAVNGQGEAVSATASAAPANSDPTIGISTTTAGTLTRLHVVGTAADDTITVWRDGSELVVDDDGSELSRTALVDEIVLDGNAGDDLLTVDDSVTCRAIVHAGDGADVLTATGPGRSILVAIGGGADILTGNGVDTSYWGDPEHLDTIHASAFETTAGRVHRIDQFYQPTTFDRTSSDHVDNEPDGARWADPDLWGNDHITAYPSHSLWGAAGPVLFDVNQGPLQNCGDTGYYQLVADRRPAVLEEALCDLGDGTYAYRMGDTGLYARVDGDVNPTDAAALGPSGSQWWLILEKGYFSYDLPAPLDGGDRVERTTLPGDDEALYQLVRTALDRCQLVLVRTEGEANCGAPLVRQGHLYGVVEAFRSTDGSPRFILRNPYGDNGRSGYNNELIAPLQHQGLLTISAAALRANFPPAEIVTLPGSERAILMEACDGTDWDLLPPVRQPVLDGTATRYDRLDRRQEHRLRPVGGGPG
ncbi:MAG: fibronectin type III domain-containing protein, partial [Planctomycetota bacterium]